MSETSWIADDSDDDDPNKSFKPVNFDDDDDTPPESDSESGSNSEEEVVYKKAARQLRAKRKPISQGEREKKRARQEYEEARDEKPTKVTGKKIAATTAGVNRLIIPNPDTTVMTIGYIFAPVHTVFGLTPSGLDPGGQSVTCILGPAALQSKNSNAQSATSLPCLTNVRAAYPWQTFYPGHLLNTQFGGPGDSTNVTVLTASANGQHKRFDNNIVAALGHLKDAYIALNNAGINVLTLGYGLHITLTVSPARWPGPPPNDCISTGLTCTAAVVNPPDVDTLIAAIYPAGQGLPDYWAQTRPTILDLIQAVQDKVD